jgi:hypothetical protein
MRFELPDQLSLETMIEVQEVQIEDYTNCCSFNLV